MHIIGINFKIMNDKQALIITDSMGAPRSNPLTLYKDTWVSHIEDYFQNKYGIKTFSYTQSSLTTQQLIFKIKQQFIYYNPRIVILQIGAVDCAPRLLTMNELDFMEKLVPNVFSKIFHKFKKYLLISPTLSRYRNRTDVSSEIFRRNINLILNEYFKDSIICTIPIGFPNKRHTFESANAKKNVEQYNDIFKSFVDDRYTYFDILDKFIRENIYKIYDKKNRHYLISGHKMVSSVLINELDKLENRYNDFLMKNNNIIIDMQSIYNINSILNLEIKNRSVYIYGTGMYAKSLFFYLSYNDSVKVMSFIDRNIRRINFINGLSIIDEDMLISNIIPNSVILIGSLTYEDEIYKRIKFLEKNNIMVIKTYSLLKMNNNSLNFKEYL